MQSVRVCVHFSFYSLPFSLFLFDDSSYFINFVVVDDRVDCSKRKPRTTTTLAFYQRWWNERHTDSPTTHFLLSTFFITRWNHKLLYIDEFIIFFAEKKCKRKTTKYIQSIRWRWWSRSVMCAFSGYPRWQNAEQIDLQHIDKQHISPITPNYGIEPYFITNSNTHTRQMYELWARRKWCRQIEKEKPTVQFHCGINKCRQLWPTVVAWAASGSCADVDEDCVYDEWMRTIIHLFVHIEQLNEIKINKREYLERKFCRNFDEPSACLLCATCVCVRRCASERVIYYFFLDFFFFVFFVLFLFFGIELSYSWFYAMASHRLSMEIVQFMSEGTNVCMCV